MFKRITKDVPDGIAPSVVVLPHESCIVLRGYSPETWYAQFADPASFLSHVYPAIISSNASGFDLARMEQHLLRAVCEKLRDPSLYNITLHVLRTTTGVCLAAVVSAVPAVPAIRTLGKLAWEHVMGDFLGD